jgi:hypothetical protein
MSILRTRIVEVCLKKVLTWPTLSEMSGNVTNHALKGFYSRKTRLAIHFQAKWLSAMHKFKLHVGRKEIFESDAPNNQFSAFFEDDGDVGYFYALDRRQATDQVVDALHVYNVANVTDAQHPSDLSIVWSADGSRVVLLINGYAHAAAKRGYCRTNFPNLPDSGSGWKFGHKWSDEAVAWLDAEGSS